MKKKQQLAFFEGGEKAKKAEVIRSAALTPEAERLLNNFEALAEAPEGIKRLRELILGLGLKGALVSQEDKDESVTKLFDRILVERTALLHGRRMGGRGHTADDDPNRPEPYIIPLSWRWCSLADVAGHIVDGTHHTPKYVDKGMDFISAKDIKRGVISFDGCRQISRNEFDGLIKRCKPQKGDVLVTKSGSIGDVAVVDTDRLFTLFESVALVPVVPSVNSQYIAYAAYQGASGSFGDTNQKGIGVPHLHLVDLRRLPVPLPPRAEQDRIVAKVDELMALCDEMEARQAKRRVAAGRLNKAALGELMSAEGPEELAASLQRVVGNFEAFAHKPESVEELRNAILNLAAQGRLTRREAGDASAKDLQNLLTDQRSKLIAGGLFKLHVEAPVDTPFTIPDGWVTVRMAALLAEPLMNGRSVPDLPNGFPVLRLSAIRGNTVDFRENKAGAWTASEAAPFVVIAGDFLIVRGNGAIRLVGRGCTAGIPPEPVAFPDTMIRARVNPLVANINWLRHVWASTVARQQIENFARTSAGIFKVNQDHIHDVMLPLPSLAEQARIVARVDHLMTLCDTLEAKLRAADEGARRLAESLVAELFA